MGQGGRIEMAKKSRSIKVYGQIRIFESRIPSTVKVGESIYYSQPLLEYAPESRVCRAYMDFGRELIGYEG
jgi:chromosome partitioning protein